MADDLGGDALADLALGLGIDRQGEVGMRLDVDEARRDGEPAASMILAAGAGELRPIAAMRPSCDGEVAGDAGAPLPSKSVPPRIRMSNDIES